MIREQHPFSAELNESHCIIFAIIRSAENWLAENELSEEKVLKWDTALWGENPADFGRK